MAMGLFRSVDEMLAREDLYCDPRFFGVRSRHQDAEIHDLKLEVDRLGSKSREDAVSIKNKVKGLIAYYYNRR